MILHTVVAANSPSFLASAIASRSYHKKANSRQMLGKAAQRSRFTCAALMDRASKLADSGFQNGCDLEAAERRQVQALVRRHNHFINYESRIFWFPWCHIFAASTFPFMIDRTTV